MKRLLSYLFLITIVACKNKPQKAADEIFDKIPSTQNLNVGTRHYTLTIPPGWTTKRQTYRGIDYYFLLAPKTAADPNTNINVVTESMQNFSLDVYKEKTLQAIKQLIPNSTMLAQGSIEANGIKGYWYNYTMEADGKNTDMVGYIFPRNGVAYIITAGTQPKDAARYRSTFDAVARSLKFDH